jgi:hypothetical protein
MYIIRIIDTILSDKRLQKHAWRPLWPPQSKGISSRHGEVTAGRSTVECGRAGVVLDAEANGRRLGCVLNAGQASRVHLLVAITGDGGGYVVAKERHFGAG